MDIDIVDPRVERYLEQISALPVAVLSEMEKHGKSIGFPMVGPLVGRVLQLLARSIQAKRVLELGSGFGYSAMWFASGMPTDGLLILSDHSRDNAEAARRYFQSAGWADRIDYRVGNALEIASALSGTFDIVFCDIDKESYPRALPVARSLLRVGGYFVCDNMLWKGRVLQARGDATTEGVRSLTRLLLEAQDLVTTILPVHDGLSVSLRIN
jgi:predicted O-methyltransferase YrrM